MKSALSTSSSSVRGNAAYGTGAFLLFVATAVILTALGFEYLGGQKPCPLCLQERYAYYAAIPLAFGALVLLAADYPRVSSLIFFAIALIFLANVALAGYHVGIEQKFWPGPQSCTGGDVGGLGDAPGGLLEAMKKERIVACDEVNWQFLGLSFAGWNLVMSLFLFAAAIKAAYANKQA